MTNGQKIFKNIERIANAQGKTVHEVCIKAKVSFGTINDLKHGRRNNIGNITAAKLSKELACNKEDFFASHDGTQIIATPKPRRTEVMIARAVDALKERPEMRRLIRAAMKASRQQVNATAVLLESIVQANKEGLFLSDDEQ